MTQNLIYNVQQYLEQHKREMIDFLRALVQMETPTEKPELQGPILQFLKKSLEGLDYHVSLMPGKQSGGYLFSRPEVRCKSKPIQLLVGHCDTVWPEKTLSAMPFISQNGKIKGPGVYDMKAGLTQIVYALKTIRDLDLKPTLAPVVIINSDEEKGSRDSTIAIRRIAKLSSRAFILEPPLGLDGRLKTARKGLGRFTLTIKGIAAHAGLDPTKGASAILELSHQIQQLFNLNDTSRGISVNVGMIEGGTSANVIAPISKAVIDVRVLTQEDAEMITNKIKALQPVNPTTEIIVEGYIGRPPMEKTPPNQKLWSAAQRMGQQLGLELEQGTAGGGSDGNTTSLYTATLDGLGTSGDGAHADHEYIITDKLSERTSLLIHLLLMEAL